MAETTTPTAPAAPEQKKPRGVPSLVCKTPEEAVKEAEGRTKGPRRAFTCKQGDKVLHVVAHNEGRAGGVAFATLGGTVEEIGKVKRTKVLGVDGIMAAINALPEDQRAAALAQIKAMQGGGDKTEPAKPKKS